METVIWIAIGLILPALILWLCNHVSVAERLGPVLLACVFGIVLGQVDFVPQAHSKVNEYGMNISILVGLSILLFSFNIKEQYQIIKPAIKSAIIALVALALLIGLGHWIWGRHLNEGWKVSGLLVGVYTGGTPNLATLSTALGVENELFVWMHSIDAIVSSLYLIIVLYLANGMKNERETVKEDALFVPFMHRIYAIAIGIMITGMACSVMFFDVSNPIVLIILILSSLGVLASFVPFVKRIKGSYSTSLYFILIFSVFIGSEVDLSRLTDINLSLFLYLFVVLIGTFALHMVCGTWARVGRDMLLVTSVAMICSPPFVPAVAVALGRKDLLPIGISVGIMGYLFGNYFGIGLAYLIQFFA